MCNVGDTTNIINLVLAKTIFYDKTMINIIYLFKMRYEVCLRWITSPFDLINLNMRCVNNYIGNSVFLG